MLACSALARVGLPHSASISASALTRLVGPQQQRGDQRAAAGAGELERLAVMPDLERSQDAEGDSHGAARC